MKKYVISRLSINQDTTLYVSLPNIEGQKALSNILRTYSEEKIKLNLDLRIYREGNFDVTAPFKKRTDVLINGFKYYDTTTKNQETIEFCTTFITLKILASHVAMAPWILVTPL